MTNAPETMSSIDRRTDGQTDGQGESSIPPPLSNFVGRGYKNAYESERGKAYASDFNAIILVYVAMGLWPPKLMFFTVDFRYVTI